MMVREKERKKLTQDNYLLADKLQRAGKDKIDGDFAAKLIFLSVRRQAFTFIQLERFNFESRKTLMCFHINRNTDIVYVATT